MAQPPTASDALTSDPDFSRLPVWDRGPDGSAFTVGRVLDHHWARTFDAGASCLFSAVTHMWGATSLDSSSAPDGDDPALINPYLVLCTVFGLSVEDLSESRGPFLSITDCTFGTPVHAGDRITATSTVVSARPTQGRPDSRVVTWQTEGRNQRGEVVVTFVRANLISPPKAQR